MMVNVIIRFLVTEARFKTHHSGRIGHRVISDKLYKVKVFKDVSICVSSFSIVARNCVIVFPHSKI